VKKYDKAVCYLAPLAIHLSY